MKASLTLHRGSGGNCHKPASRIKQADKCADAASIRIDDPNPGIEFVETGLTGLNPGGEKLKYRVAERIFR